METQKIQATITLTLTQEQLLTLLNAAPAQVQTTVPTPAPEQVQTTAPTPAPTPAPAPAPAQMFAQPVAAPMPQAQPMIQPVAVPVQTPAPMPTQTAPQTYSVTDLGLAARPLMENGRQQELIALLAEFGVQSVAAIPENRRADFAARLRALGGQI
ncbi:MAG: hypothetical protein IJ906_16620 [Oscillospiraceae bacterium]|nr:hypothetical protein [Oscillospiraceae bacterium]